MSDVNPYTPPKARVADGVEESEVTELASRGQRLLAAIIDGLIGLIWAIPLAISSGTLDAARKGVATPFTTTATISLIGFVLFALVHGYFLKNGQTIGKKLLGLRIVDLDNRVPGVQKILLARYLPISVVALVPYVGSIFALVDALFIFQESRRCLHDLIAGTKVVRA